MPSLEQASAVFAKKRFPRYEFYNLTKLTIILTNNMYVVIFQNQVRAGKKEYESQRAKMYGPYDKWHHLDCFVKVLTCPAFTVVFHITIST